MTASPYWRILADWPGETVVILAGGPSLTQAQVDACRGRARIIAVNDAYRLCPWADMLYFCDDKWWGWHAHRAEYRSFRGLKLTLENGHSVTEPGVLRVRNMGREGFHPEPDGIRTGGNGGYQAMHVAAHRAPRGRLLLLGFDMKAAPDGRTHWFGEHPEKTWERVYEKAMLPMFPTLAPHLAKRGIEVINCTPGSALTTWPHKPLHEALLQSHPAAVS